jgi:hypothetical protein
MLFLYVTYSESWILDRNNGSTIQVGLCLKLVSHWSRWLCRLRTRDQGNILVQANLKGIKFHIVQEHCQTAIAFHLYLRKRLHTTLNATETDCQWNLNDASGCQ